MYLPQVAITFFAFWVNIDPNQQMFVKMIQNKTDYFKFKTPVPIDEFPAVKASLGDSLVFGDKYVKVDKSQFNKGLELITEEEQKQSEVIVRFEGYDLIQCSDSEGGNMRELSFYSEMPKLYESYYIVEYGSRPYNAPNHLTIFDLYSSINPEEWLEKVELAMKKVRADPEKYGRQVLAFLFRRQCFRWLEEQIDENPKISWTTLKKSFVYFVHQWQSKESKQSPLPNGSNEPLEEQIISRMNFLNKQIIDISESELRMLVFKAFPGNSAEDFIPEYLDCSVNEFARALRLKYEQQFSKIDADDGIKILSKAKNNSIILYYYDELLTNPKFWIQSIENHLSKINVDLNVHGVNTLALLFNNTALDWLNNYVNENSNFEWSHLVDAFIQHFSEHQTEINKSLTSNYNKSEDVKQFVVNKLRLWKNIVRSAEVHELNELVTKYFEEPKQTLIRWFVYENPEEFVLACQLAFDNRF